jgi:RNA polymerase sigma-70 factor (ECF subfamily)
MRIAQARSAPMGPVDQRRPLLGYGIRLARLLVRSQRITARASARHFVRAGSGVIVLLQRRLREWSVGTPGGTVLSVNELELLEALRRGDEQAFITLVETHGASMLRLARVYVRDRAVAEEAVQEAWLGVLRGIQRFEGRSSLRTWLLHIVANLARTRAVREARSIPFSALAGAELEAQGPSVPPERFRGPQDRWAGHWATPPQEWNRPEHELLSAETSAQIVAAIDALPEKQRQVITLRDVEGCSAAEVCNVLELSETNQRVLLHRARTKVRQALDDYLTTSEHQETL